MLILRTKFTLVWCDLSNCYFCAKQKFLVCFPVSYVKFYLVISKPSFHPQLAHSFYYRSTFKPSQFKLWNILILVMLTTFGILLGSSNQAKQLPGMPIYLIQISWLALSLHRVQHKTNRLKYFLLHWPKTFNICSFLKYSQMQIAVFKNFCFVLSIL